MAKKVVLIMTDTQRTDMLGCYGNSEMKTPNIDKLADEGLLFKNAYTTQPVCTPARSAIFTGLFPHSNGAWSNCLALGDNVKTIGQRLRDNNIKAGYIGKWHLDGGDYFGLGRCPDGWDENYWYDMRLYLEELSEDFRVKSRKWTTMTEEHIDIKDTYAHRVSDRAIRFLNENKDNDFFLAVSYDEPHDPYLCPEPFASMYKDVSLSKNNVYDSLENKPAYQKLWAQEAKGEMEQGKIAWEQYFLGCNSFVDHEIGRVLEHIDNDTLIIYTSDHGDFLGAHGLKLKGPAFYDEIAKIPFIIKGGVKGVNESPTSHIDITPTILEYFGIALPKWLDGKSMMPILDGSADKINDYIFCEFGRYEVDHDHFGGFQPMRSIFDGRYKLSINLLSTDELYDLKNDPHEINNLINDENYKGIRNKLHDEIIKWQNETRDPFRGYYWLHRPYRDDLLGPTWAFSGYTRQRENEEYEPKQLDYSTGLEMETAVRKK
ncbi:MAG: sulfatase-like hydrolase/transferase [Eubacteriales bacterium]|jgi:uncharacterized sulfatase|nr:sulfatase-like hydrolase/transferase [Eubacteriales bacterium]